MSGNNMLGISLGDFLRPMIDFFNKLLSKDGEAWWGEFKHFLRKEPCWTVTQVAEQNMSWAEMMACQLISWGTATSYLVERHDPATFYRANPSLYISSDFRTEIVSKARPLEAGTVFKSSLYFLAEGMSDAEIEAVLPADHLFDETQVCAIIATMVAEQSGKQGGLLNRCASLLYTSTHVIEVEWRNNNHKWLVSPWSRCDGRVWSPGRRVFSPATET